MAVVRTEYDYAIFHECPHQKLFFDLKDKNYTKAKTKGGLSWRNPIFIYIPMTSLALIHYSLLFTILCQLLLKRTYIYTLESIFTKEYMHQNGQEKNEMLDCVSGRGFAWELNPDFFERKSNTLPLCEQSIHTT